jgi:hypothetical protein
MLNQDQMNDKKTILYIISLKKLKNQILKLLL